MPYAERVKTSTAVWGGQDADTPLSQGQARKKTIPTWHACVGGAGHLQYWNDGDTARVMDHF